MHVVHRCRFTEWTPSGIQSISVKQDGSSVAVARSNGDIEIWSTQGNWFCEKRIPGTQDLATTALQWANDRLYSVGMNACLVEWDTNALVPAHIADALGGPIWCASVSPNNKFIAVGCMDGTLRLFDITYPTGGPVYMRTFSKHKGRVTSVAWSPDSTLIATGGSDGRIRIWNALTGRNLLQINADKCRFASDTTSRLLSKPYVTKDKRDEVKKEKQRNLEQSVGVFDDDNDDNDDDDDNADLLFQEEAEDDDDDDDDEDVDLFANVKAKRKAKKLARAMDDDEGTTDYINVSRKSKRNKENIASCIIWAVQFIDNETLVTGDSLGHLQIWETRFGSLVQGIPSHRGAILSLCVAQGASVAGEEFPCIFAAGVDPRIVQVSAALPPGGIPGFTPGALDAFGQPMRARGHELVWTVNGFQTEHSHDVMALAVLHRPASMTPMQVAAEATSRSEGDVQPKRVRVLSGSYLVLSGGIDTQLVVSEALRFDSKPIIFSSLPRRPAVSISGCAPPIPVFSETHNSPTLKGKPAPESQPAVQPTQQPVSYKMGTSSLVTSKILVNTLAQQPTPSPVIDALLETPPAEPRILVWHDKAVDVYKLGANQERPAQVVDPVVLKEAQAELIAQRDAISAKIASLEGASGVKAQPAKKKPVDSDSSDSDSDTGVVMKGKSTKVNSKVASELETLQGQRAQLDEQIQRATEQYVAALKIKTNRDGQQLGTQKGFEHLASMKINTQLNLATATLSPNGTMVACADLLSIKLFSLLPRSVLEAAKAGAAEGPEGIVKYLKAREAQRHTAFVAQSDTVDVGRRQFPPSAKSGIQGKPISQLQQAAAVLAQGGATAMQFSPDNTMLAIGAVNGIVYIVDLVSNRICAQLLGSKSTQALGDAETVAAMNKLSSTTALSTIVAKAVPESRSENDSDKSDSDSDDAMTTKGKGRKPTAQATKGKPPKKDSKLLVPSDSDSSSESESDDESSSDEDSSSSSDEEEDTHAKYKNATDALAGPLIRLIRYSPCGRFIVIVDEANGIYLYRAPFVDYLAGDSKAAATIPSAPVFMAKLPQLDEPCLDATFLAMPAPSSAFYNESNTPAIALGLLSGRFLVYSSVFRKFVFNTMTHENAFHDLPRSHSEPDVRFTGSLNHLSALESTRFVDLELKHNSDWSKLEQVPALTECATFIAQGHSVFYAIDYPVSLLFPKRSEAAKASSTKGAAAAEAKLGAKRKKEEAVPVVEQTDPEIPSPKYRLITRYRPILQVDYIPKVAGAAPLENPTLAVVETPWINVLAKLPSSLAVRKFATGK